jgi:hypothetical protein
VTLTFIALTLEALTFIALTLEALIFVTLTFVALIFLRLTLKVLIFGALGAYFNGKHLKAKKEYATPSSTKNVSCIS